MCVSNVSDQSKKRFLTLWKIGKALLQMTRSHPIRCILLFSILDTGSVREGCPLVDGLNVWNPPDYDDEQTSVAGRRCSRALKTCMPTELFSSLLRDADVHLLKLYVCHLGIGHIFFCTVLCCNPEPHSVMKGNSRGRLAVAETLSKHRLIWNILWIVIYCTCMCVTLHLFILFYP